MKHASKPFSVALFALCLVVLSLSSCGRKKAQPNVDFSQAYENAQPLDSVYAQIAHTYQPWTDVQLPITITLIDEKGDGQSLSGRLTMTRDSAIEISLRAMGVEAATAYIDSDTVVVADKYHKQFVSETYGSVFGASGLSVGNVQDALLGAPFIPAEMSQAWRAQASDSILQSLIFTDENAQVIALYGNNDIDILASLSDKQARMALKFNFDQAKWDTGRKIKLRQAKGQRIFGVDIMQSIYSQQQ